MKKSIKVFATLLSSILIFSGCDFDMGFMKVNDEPEKTIIEEEEPKEETVIPSEGGGKEGEGQIEELISFDYIKGFAVSLSSDVIGISEEEVKIADYFDDSIQYYPDVTTYNTEELIYASADLYIEGKAFLEAIEYLKEFLPEGSVLDEELSEPIDDYYCYCDLFYKSGIYYYRIECMGSPYEDIAVVTFDVFPASQFEQYKEIAIWDWDLDDDDDYSDYDEDDEDLDQYLSS